MSDLDAFDYQPEPDPGAVPAHLDAQGHEVSCGEANEAIATMRRLLNAVPEQVAEVERLRTLVGDEDQPGWVSCSRAEAIRQANEFHAGLLNWMGLFEQVKAEREKARAESLRARTAVHRYFGHSGEVDACTVGICWTITHPDGPGTKPWQPSADEALDAASQLIGYANQAGGE
jgi:hypothetical protein